MTLTIRADTRGLTQSHAMFGNESRQKQSPK